MIHRDELHTYYQFMYEISSSFFTLQEMSYLSFPDEVSVSIELHHGKIRVVSLKELLRAQKVDGVVSSCRNSVHVVISSRAPTRTMRGRQWRDTQTAAEVSCDCSPYTLNTGNGIPLNYCGIHIWGSVHSCMI